MRATDLIWLVEPKVFADGYLERMRTAVRGAGFQLRIWEEAWDDDPPVFSGPVVFHGSLGNAARLAGWLAGSFCDAPAFHCSAWYPRAAQWLLHEPTRIVPAEELVADPRSVFASIGAGDQAFVRPDSPLKPFSGRVLRVDGVTLQALDHGFYYDDARLPVVVAPVRTVGREWRFVVVDGQVVAGSGYIAEGRVATAESPDGRAWAFAGGIAAVLEGPQPVYVLDVCEVDGALYLLELNPFSGADLYACDLDAVVPAVSAVVLRSAGS